MRTAVIVVCYVVAYVALDWVSYIHPLGPFGITPWNPPPGLSVAVLLVFGLRNAPALFVAGLVAEIAVRGWPPSLAHAALATAVVAAGYTAAAAALRTKARVDPSLATARDTARFVGIVAVATMLVAAGYVTVYALAGQIAWQNFMRSALQFWVGDALGILVTTPVLVYLLARRVRVPAGRQTRELVAQALAVAAALWVVFGIDATSAAKFFYLLFLPLIWISVRHGAPGAAFALLAIQLGIVAAVQIEGYASATVLEFQLFMSALAITGLFLGAQVSDRRRSQDALEAREAQLTSVFDTAPDGILALDEAGSVLRANEAAGAMFGTPALRLADHSLPELIPGASLGTAPFARAEYAARRHDGTVFPLEMAIGRAAGTTHRLYIAVLRDVSARKEMEGQLRERESELARSLRLAAAAETAAALAHELNQPLSAITSYVRACTLLLDRPDANRDRLVQTMQTVVGEVGRAGEIVRRLRDFFRSGTSRLERAAIADLVREGVAPFAPRLARHRIELAVEIEPGLPEVFVDRLQIDTVVHNLLANAVDAIKSAETGQRRISVHAALAGTAVRITVRDTGPGLPPEMMTGVFRPFTTTKPEGMGLGLAISRSIVENHGGRLTAERSDRGAALSFTLPVEIAAEAAA